jgi:hypothetical protein
MTSISACFSSKNMKRDYAAHKHARIKAWLARHPRYHIHYTPTYAS